MFGLVRSIRSLSLFSYAFFALFGFGSSAYATYSIVGTDAKRGHVGIAMASCVKDTPLWIAAGSAPGKGMIVAQAIPNVSARAEGQAALLFDVPPSDIVGYISSTAFDPKAAFRQYGVVSLTGDPVAFTGASNDAYAGDKQGKFGKYTYSVQGNTLTSVKVVDQASAAFASTGCDLADKLILALEAGAKGGEGDSRCTSTGTPASRAYLQVDVPSTVPGSRLAIETGYTTENPLKILRKRYNLWRKINRCPKP
jgi:uncharacterized Ntn-hydrolase superfamily protein